MLRFAVVRRLNPVDDPPQHKQRGDDNQSHFPHSYLLRFCSLTMNLHEKFRIFRSEVNTAFRHV